MISVVAWLVAAGLLGALAPDGSGAGAAVGSVFVVLLTLVVVTGLVASVVDTVKLHRRDRARLSTAHHPAWAHAHRYPPRHRFSWVFGWVMMLVLLGLAVPALPGLVNGVAYLAGAETATTFTPVSYSQSCGKGGCHTVTDGFLADGASATWPDEAPLDQPFTVRAPLWNWGFGSGLIDGDGSAIGSVFAGVLFDGFGLFVLWALAKLARTWVRQRRQTRSLFGGAASG